MNMMGLGVGGLRAPLTEMEEAHANLLRTEMQKVGLI